MIEKLRDFDRYQMEARKTAIYPNLDSNLWYPALGLAGEAGEVAEKIKKIYRDQDGIANSEITDSLSLELGDVLWYLSNIASELGLSLSNIAKANIYKLQSRKTIADSIIALAIRRWLH